VRYEHITSSVGGTGTRLVLSQEIAGSAPARSTTSHGGRNGDPSACKAVNAGSSPVRASRSPVGVVKWYHATLPWSSRQFDSGHPHQSYQAVSYQAVVVQWQDPTLPTSRRVFDSPLPHAFRDSSMAERGVLVPDVGG